MRTRKPIEKEEKKKEWLGVSHLHSSKHEKKGKSETWVSGIRVHKPPISAVAEVLLGSNLESLDLSHNPTAFGEVSALADALPKSKITSLCLSSCALKWQGASRWARALSGTQLKTLGLERNDIGVQGVCALVMAMPGWRNLTSLNLGRNSLGDTGVSALAGALPFTSMTSLDLSDNNISSCGISILSHELPSLGGLTALDLSGNGLEHRGAFFLSDVLPHTSITNLKLKRPKLGGNGMGVLARALPNTLLAEQAPRLWCFDLGDGAGRM